MYAQNGYNRRGIAYVLAMVLLVVFSSLAVAFASFTNLNLHKSDNHSQILKSRMAAESGLTFMLDVLEDVRISATTDETFCENLRAALAGDLQLTTNIGSGEITAGSNYVSVPPINLSGRQFACWFDWQGGGKCILNVTGTNGDVSRVVAMELSLVNARAMAFDYGLASRGRVSIYGNAEIVGVNDPSEAGVLSATQLHQDAIHVDGNTIVSGDLYAAGQDSYVVVEGSPTIAGSTDPEVYSDHIHFGCEVPDFPEVDVTPIAALADYTLLESDPETKSTVDNVRIPAGMNPTFSSDITINGVIYIESPNVVNFEGKCTLNGILVTEDNDQPIADSQVRFAGQVEANGVESLPDTSEFAEVKQHSGTFIAAPGFGVTFAGHFSAINGTIAADALTFTGTAEGTVKGSVIGLEDIQTSVGGNVGIYIDRSGDSGTPAGFVGKFAIVPVFGTYCETVGK